MLPGNTFNCSAQYLLRRVGVPVTRIADANGLLLAAGLVAAALCGLRVRKTMAHTHARLAYCLTVCVLLEYFLPVRFGYADVVYLPLAAMALTLSEKGMPVRVAALLLAVLFAEWTDDAVTGTTLRTVAFAAFAVAGFLLASRSSQELPSLGEAGG